MAEMPDYWTREMDDIIARLPAADRDASPEFKFLRYVAELSVRGFFEIMNDTSGDKDEMIEYKIGAEMAFDVARGRLVEIQSRVDDRDIRSLDEIMGSPRSA